MALDHYDQPEVVEEPEVAADRHAADVPAERLQTVLARAGLASRRTADRWITERVRSTIRSPGRRASTLHDRCPSMTSRSRSGRRRRDMSLSTSRAAFFVRRPAYGRRSAVELVPRTGAAGQGRPVAWTSSRRASCCSPMTGRGPSASCMRVTGSSASTRSCSIAPTMPTSRTCDPPDLEDGLQHGCSRRGEAGARRRSRSRTTPSPPGPWLIIRLGEGRKGEVRRLFLAAGYRVHRLVRIGFGSVSPPAAPGASRPLTTRRSPTQAGARLPYGDSRPPVAHGEAGSRWRTARRLGKEHRRPPWPCASAPASSIPGSCTGGDSGHLGKPGSTLPMLPVAHSPARRASGPRGGSRPWP